MFLMRKLRLSNEAPRSYSQYLRACALDRWAIFLTSGSPPLLDYFQCEEHSASQRSLFYQWQCIKEVKWGEKYILTVGTRLNCRGELNLLKKYIGRPLPLRAQRKMRNCLKEHQVILSCISFYWEIAG